ncbi:MAG: hypothetical protein WBA74_17320 [Cyclobacteriaceae bacterium]
MSNKSIFNPQKLTEKKKILIEPFTYSNTNVQTKRDSPKIIIKLPPYLTYAQKEHFNNLVELYSNEDKDKISELYPSSSYEASLSYAIYKKFNEDVFRSIY